MGSNEDNGGVDAGAAQFPLKVQPADSRQSDVEDKATRNIGPLRRHEFLGGDEELSLKANRFEKVFERNAHRWIIFNNEHACFGLVHSGLVAVGKEKLNLAP